MYLESESQSSLLQGLWVQLLLLIEAHLPMVSPTEHKTGAQSFLVSIIALSVFLNEAYSLAYKSVVVIYPHVWTL